MVLVDPAYRKLIEEFEKITGLPLILNTSLNLGGRPIAGTKWDGLQMLAKTDLDIFIFGNEVLFKDEVVD
jgi:carbamoyltransferase